MQRYSTLSSSNLQVVGYAIILAGITVYNTVRTDKTEADAAGRAPSGLLEILAASTKSPLVWVLAPAVVCVYLVGVIGVRICIQPPTIK